MTRNESGGKYALLLTLLCASNKANSTTGGKREPLEQNQTRYKVPRTSRGTFKVEEKYYEVVLSDLSLRFWYLSTATVTLLYSTGKTAAAITKWLTPSTHRSTKWPPSLPELSAVLRFQTYNLSNTPL